MANKSLHIFVALFCLLILATPVLAERTVNFQVFEATIDANRNFIPSSTPVNGIDAFGFVCADAACSDYTTQLQSSSSNTNLITVTYPTTLQTVDGYAHIFADDDNEYVTWAQRADFWGTNPSDPQGPYTIYLSKVEACRSPIDSFVVINDAHPNQPVQFEVSTSLDATVWSAIQFGGPIGFEAPQIPQNYDVKTDITLEIIDQNGNVVYTETDTLDVDFDNAARVMFEWTPDIIGRYEARVITSVPDSKCASDVPVEASKEFSIIGETTDLCYALANSLSAQPLGQYPNEPVTISFETLSNYFDELGNLNPLNTSATLSIYKDGFYDEIQIDVAAIDTETYETVIVPYAFPEAGLYNITVDARAASCPASDNTWDIETIEYLVDEEIIIDPNTPPTLFAQDLFFSEFDGMQEDIYNLEEFAVDPDQDVATLSYEITSQTARDIVDCSIDSNNNLDCNVKTPGQSVLNMRVTDDEDEYGIDLITVTVANIPECQDGLDNDNDGLTDLDDPGCADENDDDESDGTSQCQDSIDNDNDGLVDMQDPGCDSPQDNDESDGTSQCQDGIDNDNDGLVDMQDPGCDTPQDNDESDGTSQCQDGIDNDGDNLVDMNDPGCDTPQDNNESDATSACQDGIDNDNDGLVDMNDPGCTDPTDDDEYHNIPITLDFSASTTQTLAPAFVEFTCGATGGNSDVYVALITDSNLFYENGATPFTLVANTTYSIPGIYTATCNATEADGDYVEETINITILTPQCQDGLDNDNDGLTDLDDPGCTDEFDNDESDGTTQCQDGVDNDADGLIDLDDPGCSGPLDDDESDATTQCQDGIDNDNDGLVDMQDPGCDTPQDDNEYHNIPITLNYSVSTTQALPPVFVEFTCGANGANDDVFAAVNTGNNIEYSNGATPLVITTSTTYTVPGVYTTTCNATEADGDSANESILITILTPQCQDGIDNDNDGLTDLEDPGCTDEFDNDESDGTTQCQDGIDNDNDGLVDMQDPGCDTPQDNDESDGTSQCQDGIDNDYDGLVDYPQDPGCTSPQDESELHTLAGTLNFTQVKVIIYNNSFLTEEIIQRGDVVNFELGPLIRTDAYVENTFLALDFDPVEVNFEIPSTSFTRTDVDEIIAGEEDVFGFNFADGLVPGLHEVILTREDAVAQTGLGVEAEEFRFFVNVTEPDEFFEVELTTTPTQGVAPLTIQTTCYITSGNDAPFDVSLTDDDGFTYQTVLNSPFDNITQSITYTQPGTYNIECGMVDADGDDNSDQTAVTVYAPQCNDGLDNDNDGLTDLDDPGCIDEFDNNESDGTSQCQDGIDNDGDNLIDMNDPGCDTPQDDNETNIIVDTGDLEIQSVAVYVNSTSSFISENDLVRISLDQKDLWQDVRVINTYQTTQLNNVTVNAYILNTGIMADGDQKNLSGQESREFYVDFDFNTDPITAGNYTVLIEATHTSGAFDDFTYELEIYTPIIVIDPQCSDGLDNDNDGLVDYPQDPGCDSETDDDEYNVVIIPQCDDGLDNDNDGLTDLEDPGCMNSTDDSESNNFDLFIDNGYLTTQNIYDDETVLIRFETHRIPSEHVDAYVDVDVTVDGNPISITSLPFDMETRDWGIGGLGPFTAGTHTLQIVTDPSNEHNESNENNNVFTFTFDVLPAITPTTQCDDGIDNDNDGFVDMNDPGCDSPQDNDESDDPVNESIVFLNTPTGSAFVGVAYLFDLDTAPSDVTFTLLAAPTGLNVDQVTGLITWTPKESDLGNHYVTVQAEKNGITATKTFTITVFTNPNKAQSNTVEDLDIMRINFVNGEQVDAGDQLVLSFNLENNGEVSYDNMKITVTIYDLGITRSVGSFDLHTNDDITKTLHLDVPYYAPAGEYPIRVTLSADGINKRVVHRYFDVK